MYSTANDLTSVNAARMLLWLRDMGADEVIADQPINRFLEKPPQPKARPAVLPQQASAPKTLPRAATAIAPADHQNAIAAARSLADLAALLNTFENHPLKVTATNLCFHDGAEQARVLVLVDRPRNEEDRTGQVLAAKHEALAERMLGSIGLRGRADGTGEAVALLSFVPWRPPGNRALTDLECGPLLPIVRRAIALINPSLILAFGHLPGQWLAGASGSIARQRGEWLEVDGIPMLPTFHPETLITAPLNKRLTWHDLLALREKLERLS